MNRRKGKSGNASAKSTAKASTPTPTPKPSTPTPPATSTKASSVTPPLPPPPVQAPRTPTPPPPTPPPQPTPSELCRAEWKKFEEWLAAELVERLAIVKENWQNGKGALKKKPRASGLKSSQKFMEEKDPELEKEEIKARQLLAKEARVEWERRLQDKGLDEEQWTDLTDEEMKAVLQAFTPPELPGSDNNDSVSSNGHTSPLNENAPISSTSPGGWNVHHSVLPTVPNPNPPQTQSNGVRQEHLKPSPPLRTRSPSMSSWETHTQPKDNGPVQFDADESLWTKTMNGTSKSSNYTKPAVSSPLAQAVHEPEPEIQILYKIITPVTFEEEDGDFVEAGFEGLTEGALEDTIRHFHVVAADADIELRKNLLALRAEHLLKRKKLLEQHRMVMERRAREVVDGWKAARAAEKERRLNGARRSTINGYDRRAPPLSHASSTIPTLSQQTQNTDMYPGKKGALKNGTTNGKKSGVTFGEDLSAFGQERVPSPFATPLEEPGWGFGSSMAPPKMSSTARMSTSSMWGARDAPSPAPGKAPPMAKSTSSAAQAAQSAWAKKSASTTRQNGNQSRTTHATVEDANSDEDDEEDEDEEEEDEEEDILVGFGNGNSRGHGNGSSSVPGHTSSSSSASWNYSTSAFSRGATPKPDTQSRPRTMSNAKTTPSPWAEATSAAGYRPSAFGNSVSGGFGEQSARFATWKPGPGGLGTSPPIGGGEFGRSIIDTAMNNLSQNGGSEEELANVLKMASSGFETNKRRPVVASGRR